MEIPAEAEPGSYVLQTLVDCPGADLKPGTDPACGLRASSQLRLLAPVRDVIIRPASHAYRPGQSSKYKEHCYELGVNINKQNPTIPNIPKFRGPERLNVGRGEDLRGRKRIKIVVKDQILFFNPA